MSPRVSFVVPCYKLAHFLDECVDSILGQSFRDLEVIIIDDCSPDHTPEVAGSFRDRRVRYERNETNLGHVGAFNKGIDLARGEFVWIISADDRLHSKEVVQRFVTFLDANPRVGFVFCPALLLQDGKVGGPLEYTIFHDRDIVFPGHEFANKLAVDCDVPAPAVLVRRECYARATLYPSDIAFGEEWFVWAAIALRYDVGFLREPMVCYRHHDSNMTAAYVKKNPRQWLDCELQVRWRIISEAAKQGAPSVVEEHKKFLAARYAEHLARGRCGDARHGLSGEELDASLARWCPDPAARDELRRRVESSLADAFETLGDRAFAAGDFAQARMCYRHAVKQDPGNSRRRSKCFLQALGPLGRVLWRTAICARSMLRSGQQRPPTRASQQLQSR